MCAAISQCPGHCRGTERTSFPPIGSVVARITAASIGAAMLGLVALIAGLALSRNRPQDGAVDRQDEESLGTSA
jgi:hypothetical protein